MGYKKKKNLEHLNNKIKLPKKVKLVTKVDVQYDKYVLAIR